MRPALCVLKALRLDEHIDDCAVSYAARLHTPFDHPLDPDLCPQDITCLGTSIDHDVVGNLVRPHCGAGFEYHLPPLLGKENVSSLGTRMQKQVKRVVAGSDAAPGHLLHAPQGCLWTTELRTVLQEQVVIGPCERTAEHLGQGSHPHVSTLSLGIITGQQAGDNKFRRILDHQRHLLAHGWQRFLLVPSEGQVMPSVLSTSVA
mmetsp:Transcript_136433/g.380276  ORF Transcript_136433/g.380276 Transcript_136433/m.380276 type:complete len:204 (+) Transcript_136433:1459-2070(+)